MINLVSSNIDLLRANLKNMFESLLKTEEFKSHAKSAGEEMKKSVIVKLSSGRYDYRQSGDMLRVARGDIAHVQTNKTGSKAHIGFGDIDEWNIETKRGPQRGTFGGESIRLRPEPSLPAWIIMEFGRKAGSGASPKGIPKDFLVPYTQRDSSKRFLFGPSSSMHFSKRIYFMTDNAEATGRTHPGITAGKFFQRGLEDSEEKVNEHIVKGLEESMKALTRTHGGRVESL